MRDKMPTYPDYDRALSCLSSSCGLAALAWSFVLQKLLEHRPEKLFWIDHHHHHISVVYWKYMQGLRTCLKTSWNTRTWVLEARKETDVYSDSNPLNWCDALKMKKKKKKTIQPSSYSWSPHGRELMWELFTAPVYSSVYGLSWLVPRLLPNYQFFTWTRI